MPRAELYCLVVLCYMLEVEAVAEVASDSELIVVGIARRQAGGDNYDLWALLWQAVAAKRLTLRARCVKSHGGERPEHFAKYSFTARDCIGNGIADKLAMTAAEAA